jgi:hypothetical protein
MDNFGLLHYAVVFLVVALVAAAIGFGGVAASPWRAPGFYSGSSSFWL